MAGGQEKPVPGKEKSSTSSSSSTDYSSTNTPTLPDWMSSGLQGAFNQYLGGAQQFGNAINDWQAAPFSADQLAGFQSARDVVGGAGGYLPATMDELLATARGDYLYGGQGFNQAVEAAQRQVTPQVLSAFGRAGRDGGLAQVAMTQALTDPFAAQYGNERQRQLQAAQILPGMALMPSQVLQDIGKQYQQLEQFGQDGRLALYPQLFQALQGGTSMAAPFTGQSVKGSQDTDTESKSKGTSTPSYFPGSQGAGILGGVLSGAGMGAQLGSVIPGLGTGLGAGLGGLLGGIGGFF